MIHIKSQDLFSLKNKKKIKLSSAVVVIGTLRVNTQRIIALDKEGYPLNIFLISP